MTDMIKRIFALLLAVLLLIGGSMPVSALIAVQDENGNVHYSNEPEEETAPQISPVRLFFRNALTRAKTFWQRRGVLTVAILLVVVILGTVVVLTIEDEKKKQAALEKQPKKKKKKE